MDVPAPLLGGIVEPEHPVQGPLLNKTVTGLPTHTVFQTAAAAGLRGRPVSWCSPSDMGTN